MQYPIRKGVAMKEKVLKNIVRLMLLGVMIYCIFILYNTKVKSIKQQNKEISKIENKIQEDRIKDKMEYDNDEDNSTVDISSLELNTAGILYIPKINLKIAIYDSTTEEALRHGVGILETTGKLKLKDGQNVVLTTHNGDDKKDLFMNLNKLKVNDIFYTKDINEKIVKYKVYNIAKVLPTEIFSSLDYNKKESRATLMTCTPVGINSHRLLVSAKAVEEIKDKQELVEFNEQINKSRLVFSNYEIIIIFIFIISLIIFILSFIKRKEGDDDDYEIDIYEEFKDF